MPTPTTKDAKQALYAVAGVADLAVSTIRHLPAEAAKMRDRLPGEAVKTYGQLVRRGETLVTGVAPFAPDPPGHRGDPQRRLAHQGGQHPGPQQRPVHPDLGQGGQHHRPPGRRRRHQGGQGRGQQGRRQVTTKRR